MEPGAPIDGYCDGRPDHIGAGTARVAAAGRVVVCARLWSDPQGPLILAAVPSWTALWGAGPAAAFTVLGVTMHLFVPSRWTRILRFSFGGC